ncbi:MAG TPA: hypothetical protein VMH89_11210, partial [Candidatus Acidoferrum sp.]|nr:hypothetical protein [Candidatus Acidoferrum sp.]
TQKSAGQKARAAHYQKFIPLLHGRTSSVARHYPGFKGFPVLYPKVPAMVLSLLLQITARA